MCQILLLGDCRAQNHKQLCPCRDRKIGIERQDKGDEYDAVPTDQGSHGTGSQM